jgi:hypothetical protein
MDGVLVAVRTELFQLQPSGGVAAVLHGGVAGYPRRSLVGVGAALGTFQSDDEANPFILCHNSTTLQNWTVQTRISIISHAA